MGMRSIRNRAVVSRVMTGLTLAMIILAVPLADAASPAPVADGPLRVVTTPLAPFVLSGADPLAGFSIDVWNEVARRLHVDFTWQVVPKADLLAAVERGDADVAIAAIVVTPEGEKRVDFSHPYFDSGLQIMVRAQGEGRFLHAFHSIPWAAIGELFGIAILVVLLLANVLWLLERRNNPNFRKKYLPAIGEGLWGSVSIIAAFGHGDRDAHVIKRIAVVVMWLVGVVLVAQLTATVTSSQTVARLQSEIRGPGDLPGKKIAVAPGTPAADYLTRRGLPFASVATTDDGIRMLTQGEVQAVVLNAAVLQYLVAKRGNGMLQAVGPIFRPERIGIAVRVGSPLRKRINEALLALYDDGTYEDVYAKWFARGN
jgi:ABC-type amino acid transport substrate-binding protein